VPTLLLLGQIRRYKNVPELVAAFLASGARGAHLAVVGEVRGDPTLATEIDALAASPAVTARLERVPTPDVPVWHAAADVVVLPYSLATTLHSGAALLALSMGTPVVVPDTGTMRELQAVAGPDWVRTFTGGPAGALSAALDVAGRERGPLDLGALDWPHLGRLTAAAYREVARRR
jgi:glycosyltransferase involved in cell wall biosynthesis